MFIPQLTKACLILLPLILNIAQADIYRWVDDDKLINFTQQPPIDRPFEHVYMILPPPIAPQAMPEATQQLLIELDDIEAQREAEALAEQQQAALAAFRKESCDIATSNLETYLNNPGRRFINESGEVTRPTEEERQVKMSGFREDIEKFC